MKKTGLVALLMVLLFAATTAFADDALMKKAQTLFKPILKTVSEVKGKTFSPEEVELGKMLYLDPRLSASELISCNTCHNLGMGGADFHETSIPVRGYREWNKKGEFMSYADPLFNRQL